MTKLCFELSLFVPDTLETFVFESYILYELMDLVVPIIHDSVWAVVGILVPNFFQYLFLFYENYV